MSVLVTRARELAEGFLALEKKLPPEWDANQLGYEIGALTDTANELLPLLNTADGLLREAWQKGVKDAEEAREYADGLVRDLDEAERAA